MVNSVIQMIYPLFWLSGNTHSTPAALHVLQPVLPNPLHLQSVSPHSQVKYFIFYSLAIIQDMRGVLFFCIRYKLVWEQLFHRRNLFGDCRPDRHPYPMSKTDQVPYHRFCCYTNNTTNTIERCKTEMMRIVVRWDVGRGSFGFVARQATYRRGGGLNRVCVWPSYCDGLAKVCLPCGCAERDTTVWRDWYFIIIRCKYES
jgi:hypothetical protein